MAKKRLPSKPIAAPSKPMKSDSRGKVKSDFPKHTLQDALRVAKTLEEKNGGRPLPPTEMAIALEMSPWKLGLQGDIIFVHQVRINQRNVLIRNVYRLRILPRTSSRQLAHKVAMTRWLLRL